MRCFMASIALLAGIAASAHSQEPASVGAEQRVTYFLIDASGSMRAGDNAAEAEREIQKVLGPLTAANPEALVSRTYFRAQNRDLCSHPIKLSDPVPAIQSNRAFPAPGNNDYTPLGTALESAIKHVGDAPADIYIVSDEQQTPDCGVDICEVAEAYLWADGPDINIRTIPIGEDARSHSRLSCIADASTRVKAKTTDLGTPPLGAVTDGADSIERLQAGVSWKSAWSWVSASAKSFIRNWYWLGAIAFIATSAFLFGRREGKAAREYEEWTKEARSYQDLIRDGDEKAAKDLDTLIDTVRRFELGGERKKERSKFRHMQDALTPRSNSIGYFGFAAILALAMLPPKIFGISLAGTKDIAWGVANSEFATAFAVMWIAVVFYAGSQFQRRQEARHYFGIVTQEAKRTADREKSEAIKLALGRYEALRQEVQSIATKEIIELADRIEKDKPNGAFREDAVIVATRLSEIAVGPIVSAGDSFELIKAQADRLAKLTKRLMFDPKIDAGELIARLEREGQISHHKAYWGAVKVALHSTSVQNQAEAISRLAEQIRESAVN